MPEQLQKYQFDGQAWLASQGYLDRKLLFLDLNFWIRLSKPRTGLQVEIRDRLVELVSSSRLICPVSPSLLMELGKQPPSSPRQSQSELMDELCGGLGIKIWQRIFPVEFEAALEGNKAPRRVAYSQFFDSMVESGLALDRPSNIPEGIAQLAAKIVLGAQARLTITEFMNVWFDIGRDEVSGTDPVVSKMSRGFSDKAVEAEHWKLDNPTSLASIEQAEFNGLLREVVPDIWNTILRTNSETTQLSTQRLVELLHACPTFWCIYKAMAAIRWGGRVKENDIWDVLHIASVTPYVDCIACDRGTRHIFTEMLHADQRFGAVIVAQEADLLEWLVQNN